MKMNFSESTWKYGFLTFVVILSLFCLAFVSCGVVALGCVGSWEGAYIVTLVGCIIFCICSIGCFASLRESYGLSIAFVVSAALGIIMQITVMITFLVMKNDFLEMGVKRVENLWEHRISDPNPLYEIQELYECCGKEGSQNYIKDDDDILPASCCQNMDCTEIKSIFTDGCTNSIIKFFEDQGQNLILTSLGTIVTEVLALVSAYYLAKSVRGRVLKVDQIIINE